MKIQSNFFAPYGDMADAELYENKVCCATLWCDYIILEELHKYSVLLAEFN